MCRLDDGEVREHIHRAMWKRGKSKIEKADNQRTKELTGTFLGLHWLPFGNEIGKD